MSSKIEKSDAEWRSELAPEAYQVLRHEGTERQADQRRERHRDDRCN